MSESPSAPDFVSGHDSAAPPAEPWRARRVAVAAALAWLAAASLLAFLQEPGGDPLRPPSGLAWWLQPVERNALLRLPSAGEIAQLARHPETGHLFGVGRGGLVLRSADGGLTWDQAPVEWGADGAAVAPAQTASLAIDDVRRASYEAQSSPAQQALPPPDPKDDPYEQKAAPNLKDPPVPRSPNIRVPRRESPTPTPEPEPPPAPPLAYADLSQIEFGSGGRGTIRGERDTVLVTEDAGATWRRGVSSAARTVPAHTWSLPYEPPFERITARFSDGDRGWAGDDAGRIHATADGGVTWETRDLPLTRRVVSIVASEARVVAALEGYGLVHSDDGGDSWSVSTAPALRDAHFMPDGLRGWAVGDAGVSLQTEDGGSTWTVVPAGTHENLFDVVVLDDGRRGWMAAADGVLRTVDGGASWALAEVEPGPAGVAAAICMDRDGRRGVHVRSQDRFASVHDGFVTADGGVSWTPASLPDLAAALAALQLADGCPVPWLSDPASGAPPAGAAGFARQADGRLWAVGAGGLVAERSGPGGAWSVRDGVLPASYHASSIAFSSDGARGWIAGMPGDVWATADRGATWRRQAVGSRAALHTIVPVPRGGAIGLTAGSTIYRSADGVTWSPLSHAYFPAPWFYVAVLIALGVMALVVSAGGDVVTAAKPSVADVFVSDRPLERGDPDALALHRIASGIARFLANEKTDPPLTIAITGEWGSGKTSLMNLARAMLRDFGFRTVWFNAWHHQTEEHLLGALIESLRRDALQPWWAPRGFAVRIRLLLFRGARRWVPAALAFVAFGAAAGYFLQEPSDRLWDAATWIKGLLRFDASRITTENTVDVLSVVGTAGGLLRLVKGMQAFGASGKRFSAALSAYDPLKDLRLPTGFRHQFADTFRDITRALAPQQLVIFIDDLDRCQPANVVATLEMVNFLVSSGRCIVILGMARDRVERCVGLGFKDVAALGAGEADGAGVQRLETFARQYLEKLINIEIPVPKPSATQSQRLLDAAFHRRDRYAERWTASALNLAQWVAAAVAVLMLGGIGYRAGIWMHGEAARIDAEEKRTARVAAVAAGDAQADAAPGGVAPAPADGSAVRREAVLVPPAEGRARWFPIGLAIFVGLLVAAPRLTRVPVHVEHDSEQFTSALDRWFPLVYGKTATPRAIKRFLNRVRFYAMSQRETGERPGEEIPEDALVTLSVLQHVNDGVIPDDVRAAARLWRAPGARGGTMPGDLAFELESALRHRERFERMAQGAAAVDAGGL